ncbi:MAG: ubiquinol-cytochrome c reductase iron-sulfur subunit [Sulfuricella sp.]|nr:ubiquinol-cytochrome c reductase iron-sulfur subunit [Sulfuricella sp.]
METPPPSATHRKRIQLIAGLCAVAGAVPLILRYGTAPSYPSGNPLPVGIGELPVGKLLVIDWHGQQVYILRRSAKMIGDLERNLEQLTDPQSAQSRQPDYCRNPLRSRLPEIFVAMGVCTHQGCAPALNLPSDPGVAGEFLCPCHSSKYDLAGRVFRQGPAPANLVIPAHRYADATRLVIGEE